MGLVSKQGKKAAAVFPESEEEDDHVDKLDTNFVINEELSDPTNCTWLSSDCVSPCFLTLNDQQSLDPQHLDWWDLSLDGKFLPILSASGSSRTCLERRIFVFDGSRINPIEEACLVLDKTSEDIERVCGDDLQAGEVVSWLHCSVENDIKDSSVTCSDSAESSFDPSIYDDSSVFESSSTSLSTYEDYFSPQLRDSDRTDIWVSLLDLEAKDFEWISDKETGFDAFQSDFPSPSCNRWQNFNILFPASSHTPVADQKSNFDSPSDWVSHDKSKILCDCNEGNLMDFDNNEPLFWPFDLNSYGHPKESDFLCMSPHQNKGEIAAPDGFSSPKSVRLRIQKRHIPVLERINVQGGGRRRILSNSRSTITTLVDCKSRYRNNSTKKISNNTSRFGCSTNSSVQQSVHVSTTRGAVNERGNSSQISCQRQLLFHSQQLSPAKDLLQFNRDKSKCSRDGVGKQFQLKSNHWKAASKSSFENVIEDQVEFLIEGSQSNEEVPIEMLVGLNEFDGHEGIDVEFNKDHFSFNGELCRSPSTIPFPDKPHFWEGNDHESSSSFSTSGLSGGTIKVNDCCEGNAEEVIGD